MIEQKAAAAEGSGISALRHASHNPLHTFGLQERDKTGTEEEHTKQKGRGDKETKMRAVFFLRVSESDGECMRYKNRIAEEKLKKLPRHKLCRFHISNDNKQAFFAANNS